MAHIGLKQLNLSIGLLTIESAQIEDAEEIIAFIKQVDSESPYLMRESGEFNMSLENERKFIEDKLLSQNEIFLVAKVNGKVIGTLGFSSSHYKRYKHKGQFGVSIVKQYWGCGVGRQLIETLLNWADDVGIVKITLEVDANNLRAISLYKKLDFEEEGILKNDKYLGNGVYIDSIVMGRINDHHLNRRTKD